MQLRKVLLENEKGQQFDMNDYKRSCLLTSPSGLGYSNSSEFEQLGNIFIENNKKIDKKDLAGVVNFRSYDNCKKFIDFIERSEKIKFVYITPINNSNKTYYKDVSIKEFDKTEKKIKTLACPIKFNGLSLWYEQITTIYKIEPQSDEIRWDFKWDSKFSDYDTRSLQYINNGHIEAPILVEIDGHVVNPCIELYVEGQLYQTVKFNVEIGEYEKLLYGTATLCMALLLVLKVFVGAGISHLNMSIEKMNYDIQEQEKKNESLTMKVNELTSFDKVREVATNMGLEYNNDNIIVVNR